MIASTPERFLVIPTYFCNLRCTYCYQRELDRKAGIMSEDVMKAMFDAFLRIRNKRRNSYKPPVVMLFGGEPLINRQKQPELIELILAECQKMGYLTKIITNGVDLEFFTDLISTYNVVRHVHVTMDGPKSIHDKRRRYANGGGTFEKIVRGIDNAIEKGINIEIHVNLDRENIKALPQFADFIMQKGWIESKLVRPHLSAVQQGTCSGEGNCLTWSSICNRVFQFYRTKPQTSVFSLDLPLVQLFEKIIKGEVVLTQRFAYCGANTKMFAFDLHGNIYVCNGNVGNKEFSVGRFYPLFKIDGGKLTSWRNRNILTIPGCRDCRLSLLCGGGCGAAALRKNGTLGAPFCEPVEESMKCISKYYASRLKEVLLPTVTPGGIGHLS